MTKPVPVVVGLVAQRPLPGSLLHHARSALGRAGGTEPAAADTSRPGWFGMAVRADVPAGTDLAALSAELRGPAIALGVDCAVTSGPLAAQGPGLLVMDVDSTFITAEVVELLAEHAGTRAEVAAVTERAMRGELEFAASLAERVATLAGLDAAVLADVLAVVEITAGARELVDAVHAGGGKVGLVSGGFEEIVDPLARDLGVDHVAANTLETDGGRLTGRTSGRVVDRAAKERYLREWAAADSVPPERTVAVGDGANDLDMIAAAGLGIAFCAKPIVVSGAPAALSFPRLDAVLGLLGR